MTDKDITWYKDRYHKLLDDQMKSSSEIEQLQRCKNDLKSKIESMNRRMSALQNTVSVLCVELSITDAQVVDKLMRECVSDQE